MRKTLTIALSAICAAAMAQRPAPAEPAVVMGGAASGRAESGRGETPHLPEANSQTAAVRQRAPKHPLRAGRGGFLTRRGPGAPVVFLDMREKTTDLAPVILDIQSYSRLAIDMEKEKSEDAANAVARAVAMREEGRASAVIAIVEAGSAPALTVCPEDAVAVINASRLRRNLPSTDAEAVFAKRLGKEIWRAVAFSLCGYESQDPCVLKLVTSETDIDDLEMRMYCPSVNMKVDAAARRLGVARMQLVPYGLAVKQGWAPAPTNDAQRAIWDAVKAQMATNAPAATLPAAK